MTTPPFIEARVFMDSFSVGLAPGTPLEQVVRISTGSLRPGMNEQDAVAAVGPISSKRTDDRGTYYSFGPSLAPIELTHLQFHDSGPVDHWVLTATPKDSSIASILCPGLISLMERAGPLREISVHEHGGSRPRAFSASIKDGKLLYLTWYSLEGSPHAQGAA